MSLFDTIGNFFSPKTTTQGTTASQQQGQQAGASQSNLWPQLGGYFNNFASTAFNPQPFNGYQLGAAGNQAGVAGGLGTAFNTANLGAQGGLYNAGSYAPFMSPYLNNVAASTVGVQGLQKAQDLSALRGNQAVKGALGNNTGSEAAYLAGRVPYDTAAINQIYNQGFNTANTNAQTAAGLGYQGAGLAGSLTGAATGANQGLFGMGQTLWGDPMSWLSQGASALSPWTQAAGQNYSGTSSGNSTGQTNQTQQTNDPFGNLMTMLGLGLKGYGAWNAPTRAAGGRIPRALGGAVGSSSFADKVRDADATLKEMQSGGTVAPRHGYATDGWVTDITDMGPLNPTDAQGVVDQAKANDSSAYWNKMGDTVGGLGRNASGKSAGPGGPDPMAALRQQQAGLGQFMAQSDPRQFLPKMALGGTPRHGYATDGAVWGPGPEDAPVFPSTPAAAPPSAGLGASTPFETTLMRLGGEEESSAPVRRAPPGTPLESYSAFAPRRALPEGGGISGYLNRLGGAFSGEYQQSPVQDLGNAFLSAGVPGAQRMVQSIRDAQKDYLARIAADQHWATLSGKLPGGGATLAAKAQPSEIASREAQAGLARAQTTSAGFDAQLALKGAEAAQAQYLKRAQDLFYLRMVKDNPSNPNREADMASITEQEAANEKLGQQLRTQMLAPKPGTEAAKSAATPPPSSAAPSGAPGGSAAPSATGHTVTAPDGIKRAFPANTPPEQMKAIAWQEYQARLRAKGTNSVPGIAVGNPLPGLPGTQ